MGPAKWQVRPNFDRWAQMLPSGCRRGVPGRPDPRWSRERSDAPVPDGTGALGCTEDVVTIPVTMDTSQDPAGPSPYRRGEVRPPPAFPASCPSTLARPFHL